MTLRVKEAEAVAWSLLQQHSRVLEGKLMPSEEIFITTLSPVDDDTIVLNVDATTMDKKNPHVRSLVTLGAHMRLAVDVVNACCACRALAPATNQRFWRRVIGDLLATYTDERRTEKYSQLVASMGDSPRFTERSFAHYALMAETPSSKSRNGELLWRGFLLHGDGSEKSIRTSIHRLTMQYESTMRVVTAALAPYVLDPIGVRALRIVVLVDSNSIMHGRPDDHFYGAQRHYVLDLLMDYATASTGNTNATRDLKLHVVLRHAVDRARPLQPSDSRDVARLCTLTNRGMALARLVLVVEDHQYGGRTVTDWLLLSSLAELLRAAFPTSDRGTIDENATGLFLRSLRQPDLRIFGAALSIVPFTESLVALEVLQFVPQSGDRLLRLAWLAFALFHPRRRLKEKKTEMTHAPPLLSLKLVAVDTAGWSDTEMQYWEEEIVRTRVPLRAVVAAVLETRYGREPVRVDYYALGSTVIVPQGTPLLYEPGVADSVAVTLVVDETLDLVAWIRTNENSKDGFVGLVYPGYGLVWAQQSSNPTTTVVVVVVKPELDPLGDERAALSSLYFQFGGGGQVARAASAAPLRLLTWRGLQSLDLRGVRLSRETFRQILASSPLLRSLALRSCRVQSLCPLLDASTTSTGCVLSSLTLLDVQLPPKVSFAPLLDALVQPTHAMATTLRVLQLELATLSASHENADFQLLVRVLQQPRVRLERVDVVIRMADQSHARLLQLLRSLQGRLLTDAPPAIQWAIQSVFQANACSADVLTRTVLQFVGRGDGAEQSLCWSFRHW